MAGEYDNETRRGARLGSTFRDAAGLDEAFATETVTEIGESAIGRIHRVLGVTLETAARIRRLHDKLLGAAPEAMSKDTKPRAGDLGELRDRADFSLACLAEANAALAALERELING